MSKMSQLRAFVSDSDGVGTSTSLFLLIISMLLGGIAIDFSNGLRTKARLQALADSVALSSAMHLHDPDQALEVAQDTVEKNVRQGVTNGIEITDDSIELGIWNGATNEFQPDGFNPNAVRVTALNSARNNNAVRTFLLRLAGIDALDVGAVAIGMRPVLPPCSGGGYFARGHTRISNHNSFSNGFCLHGQDGVTVQNTNVFEPGTTISMPNLADFVENNNNSGAREALRRGSHNFARLDALPGMINAMSSGNRHDGGFPDYITSGPVYLNGINRNTNLTPGTLYIVNGNVNLGSNNQVERVGIVANGTIRVNSNVTVRNTVMAATGEITFNSNNTLGETAENYCASGSYSTYILSRSRISFNTNSTFRGVMMLTDGSIDTGNNNDSADGVYAEAGGGITLGNANRNSACEEGLERDLGPQYLNDVIPMMVF